jgi:transposase
MTLMETKKKHTPTYTAEFRERGVRLYREHRSDYPSDNAAYRAIASKLGCSHDTLRAWCIQAARDAGERSGLSSAEKARIKELERENRELRTANEILKKASAYFAQAELDRPFRK